MVFMFNFEIGLFKELFSLVLRTLKYIKNPARTREINSTFYIKPLNILYIYLQNEIIKQLEKKYINDYFVVSQQFSSKIIKPDTPLSLKTGQTSSTACQVSTNTNLYGDYRETNMSVILKETLQNFENIFKNRVQIFQKCSTPIRFMIYQTRDPRVFMDTSVSEILQRLTPTMCYKIVWYALPYSS